MASSEPGRKPALIFDGDCGFCRYWVGRWHRRTGNAVIYLPFQDPAVADRYPEVSTDAARNAVQWVAEDGTVDGGARAVFALMQYAGLPTALHIYDAVPPFAWIAELVYRTVARHRPLFSRLTLVAWGRGAAPSTYALSTWLFLRLLGIVYFAAFASLAPQVRGLIGRAGIMPAGSFAGIEMTDGRLLGLCVGGALLAALLAIGIAPVVLLPLLWLGYWALSSMSGDFLAFQWDALLLETGLLAIFLAPLAWRDRPSGHEPRTVARWLVWWLLFRLMLASGIVKLASGDPTWRDFTALSYHYETQPLPTPIAWYAYQLPLWFHRASTVATFGVELLLPWLIPAPRRLRAIACGSFVVLQLLIALTGNYAFFNVLTIALALTLLDDAQISWWLERVPRPALGRRAATSHAAGASTTSAGAAGSVANGERPPVRRWARAPIVVFAAMTVPVSLAILLSQARLRLPGTTLILPIYDLLAPLRSVNGYGLFAVMTTTRPEIIVEGSADGVTWKPYVFRYKPGATDRALRWVAPHQPRLDWQMWFAALGDPEPWFEAFCQRLLENSPSVLALLEQNPFANRPPAFVRATLYQYRYADRLAHARGVVWTRTALGPYSPVFQTNPHD